MTEYSDCDPSNCGMACKNCTGTGPMEERMGTNWTLGEAIKLCREIEAVVPPFGCHVALTGGTLYKDGERKDLDILFYRIRQVEHIDSDGLFTALNKIGVVKVKGFGWCHKATYHDKKIDIFFPEELADGDSEYGSGL